jgi:hypothetical protein
MEDICLFFYTRLPASSYTSLLAFAPTRNFRPQQFSSCAKHFAEMFARLLIVLATMALAASFSPTAMRSGTKGLKIAKLNMGLWDDLQKAFTQQVGGSTIPAPSGSFVSSVSI